MPHEVNLRHALEAAGLGHEEPLAKLCHDGAVKELMLKDLNGIGKKNRFKQLEMLESVILTADEWSTESGLLTAAQKLQRGPIAKAYAAEIKVC